VGQAIVEALERNRTLVELVLNKNNIGQQGTEVPQRFFSDRLSQIDEIAQTLTWELFSEL
jgi:hypothetical protein